jgi:hypothetical protein
MHEGDTTLLTRQEIEEWNDPPCTEQAEWLLKLADKIIGSKRGDEEIDFSIPMPLDQLSTDFLREKAEECLALSYHVDDPKRQIAILKLATWWMRLAECAEERRHTMGDASG